jgi:RNase P/RNase MRP subunit p30
LNRQWLSLNKEKKSFRNTNMELVISKYWGYRVGYLIQDFKNVRTKLSRVADFIYVKLLTVHVIQAACTNTQGAEVFAVLLNRRPG